MEQSEQQIYQGQIKHNINAIEATIGEVNQTIKCLDVFMNVATHYKDDKVSSSLFIFKMKLESYADNLQRILKYINELNGRKINDIS